MLGSYPYLTSCKTIAPAIAGIEIIKENSAAVSFFIPSTLAANMVEPEREIPGEIAIA